MSVKVHNVRFYGLEPKSINVMTCERSLGLLALSRSDNSIEVWNISHLPYLEKTIVGTCGTIEDLGWFNRRLFSGGLQGSVIEYDLCTQMTKGYYPVTSGACWCIAVEKKKKQLAAGTEDGYINIFDISGEELVFTRLLDRQEGRILCMKWDSAGNQLVTGSVDTVRVWNVTTGHAVHRMNTGRSVTSAPTVVWSIDLADDFTIVTGDSRGMLCFWDGIKGVSLTSFQSHKADVLSVCFDDTQRTVYCAGVDPLIRTYEKVSMRRGEMKWIKSVHRFIHDHDVRCLNFWNGRLYSAGVDGYLALSSYPPKMLLKFPPLLQPPSVSTAEGRLLLLRYPVRLELWRLGTSGEDSPVHLLQWQPPSEYHITCAQISRNANWLACSTLDRFRLYRIRYDEGVPSLKVVRVKDCKKALASHRVSFSGDSKTLVAVTLNSTVHVIRLSSSRSTATLLHSFHPLKNKDMTDSILQLAISNDATYIAGADPCSNIVVWSQGKVYVKLPVYKCAPTAMAIHPSKNNLVIVYADHMIVEYSLESRCMTDLAESVRGRLPKQWLNRKFSVSGVSFDPANENAIIIYDDALVLVINRNKLLQNSLDHLRSDSSVKIPKLEEDPARRGKQQSNKSGPLSNTVVCNVVRRNKHLVHFGALCDGEMVAVEVPTLSLKERLPPPSSLQKQFSKM